MSEPREILEFSIDAYTPDTLPMGRLAEYMADLAALLGETDRVHFVALKAGSATVVHAVEQVAVSKVRQRVKAARTGEGRPDVLKAFSSINQRLREDGAKADLVLPSERETGGKLLHFPGAHEVMAPEYGPFREPGTLYGIPVSVGGRDRLANVNLQDGDATYFCDASRDIAVQIAPLIYNYQIRVDGTGQYVRTPDGTWEMKRFQITSFEKLDATTLDDTIDRLRGITRRTKLPRNVIQQLEELRREPTEA